MEKMDHLMAEKIMKIMEQVTPKFFLKASEFGMEKKGKQESEEKVNC